MDKVIEQQSFSKYDICVKIKFFALLEKRPPEIHQILCDTLGTSAPSIQTVQKWMASFEGGRLDVEDKQSSGRPQTSTTGDNVEQVRTVVEEDRRRTCQYIENITGIPHSTVYRILVDVLMKKKIFAKWVPHLFNEDQREERVRLCRANLRRFRCEGQDFLSRIVTGDETWVYSWDPELKWQSAQWRNQGSPRPEKARRKQGARKVMHIVFFNDHQATLNKSLTVAETISATFASHLNSTHWVSW